MHHRTVFRAVDGLTGKHRVAVGLHAAFARQVQQQGLGVDVYQVLGQVGKHMGRGLAEARKTLAVTGKGLSQVQRAGAVGNRGFKCTPGGGAVTTYTGHGGGQFL